MPIVRHLWEFGDGDTSSDPNPIHLYRSSGVYTVKHTVWDHRGLSSSSTGTVTVYRWSRTDGALNVSRTNKCYCYGFNRVQGYGPHERSGSAFPFPEGKVGMVKIVDTNNQPHTLVLDLKTGKFHDITTRDGYSGSGLVKRWKDAVGTDGTGGTDIAPSVTFGEDRGSAERHFVEHKESHVYLRPFDEDNRGESGYDSNGYPTGLEVDLSIFKNGEQSTAESSVDDIPATGDIHFDEKVEGHRLYLKATANKGDHLIIGREQVYVQKDRAASPANRKMSNDTYQQAFASPVFWLGYFRGNVINRVTGVTISGVSMTAVTGPDSQSSGMQFTSAQGLGTVTVGASGSLLIWTKGTVALTIGGDSVSLTAHDTSGDWTLRYADTVGKSGALVVTPTGTASVYDIRAFNTAISSAQRTYYYNDIIDGGHVMAARI